MLLNEKETEKHNFIRDIFDGTCEINDYRGISVSNVEEDGRLLKDPITETLKKMSDEKKCYYHSICFDENEKEYFVAFAKNEDNVYIDTEIVNMAVKFLHNLDIYDLIVTIGGKKDNTELLDNLDALDIPAGKDDGNYSKPYDSGMFFDIYMDEKLLVHGGHYAKDKITYFIINYNDVESVVDYDLGQRELDAFISPRTEDCVNDAFIIGTNLKDAGFRVVTNYNLDKFDENELPANFLITFDEDSIKNYEVHLKDLKTKEEHTVKIDNLVEELSFL